jgi:hypothetical protein
MLCRLRQRLCTIPDHQIKYFIYFTPQAHPGSVSDPVSTIPKSRFILAPHLHQPPLIPPLISCIPITARPMTLRDNAVPLAPFSQSPSPSPPICQRSCPLPRIPPNHTPAFPPPPGHRHIQKRGDHDERM